VLFIGVQRKVRAMAELKDFDPESMTDAVNALISFAEDVAKEALASEMILDDFERREIVLALTGIRPAADALVEFIKLFRLNPENENGHLVVLCKLMLDLITIGSASTYTKDVQAHLEVVRVSLMRMRHSGNAQTRKKKIRLVILKVCEGTPLKRSPKFAESIRSAVCEKLGVKTDARGYSARTLQRIISAILKERGES
jgi:hypothetical protein